MKKRTIWQRIKWGNVLITGLLLGCLVYGGYRFTRPAKVVKTYTYTVQAGDTLWSVCSEAKLPEQDVRELVYHTMQENQISDPGALQPGTLVIIRVKPVKGGEKA